MTVVESADEDQIRTRCGDPNRVRAKLAQIQSTINSAADCALDAASTTSRSDYDDFWKFQSECASLAGREPNIFNKSQSNRLRLYRDREV